MSIPARDFRKVTQGIDLELESDLNSHIPMLIPRRNLGPAGLAVQREAKRVLRGNPQ